MGKKVKKSSWFIWESSYRSNAHLGKNKWRTGLNCFALTFEITPKATRTPSKSSNKPT